MTRALFSGLIGLALSPLAFGFQDATPRATACMTLEHPRPTPNAIFGHSVLPLDFNRDGIKDLAVGAPGDKNSGLPGQVFIFYGPLTPSSSFERLVPISSEPEDEFGWSLAAGDITDDGHMELIVGAPGSTVANVVDAGRASVWHFDGARAAQLFEMASPAPVPYGRMGVSVATGNFLGDERTELAVGIPKGRNYNSLTAGTVALYRFVPGSQPILTVVSNPAPLDDQNRFGHALSVADWNNDGRDDLVVSAIFNHAVDGGQLFPYAGQVFVFASPVFGIPAATINNPSPWVDDPFVLGQPPACSFQRFGMSIDAADLNGDGRAEVAIGAPRKDDLSGICDPGKGYVVSARTFTPQSANELEFERYPVAANDLVGYRVHFADVIGDRQLDAIVGSLATNRRPALLVWDGARVVTGSGLMGLPDSVFLPPNDMGAHVMGGFASAQLREGAKQEVILGDFDYSEPGLSSVGRVMLVCW